MATIFSSGCYIYTIIVHFFRLPVFDLLFYRSDRPFYTIDHLPESRSAVARDVDYPVLIPSHTGNGACKCLARESEVNDACESEIVYQCVCLTQNA